jgi:hypothetical protein
MIPCRKRNRNKDLFLRIGIEKIQVFGTDQNADDKKNCCSMAITLSNSYVLEKENPAAIFVFLSNRDYLRPLFENGFNLFSFNKEGTLMSISNHRRVVVAPLTKNWDTIDFDHPTISLETEKKKELAFTQ